MQFSLSKVSICAAVVSITAASSSHAEQATATSLADMVKQGKVSLNLRYRYEYVDDDGFDDEAKASTLRSRLTLASASYLGFSFLTEFDDVSYIGDDDFNSTDNGKTEYPIVADPKGTEVNQAWLAYRWRDLSGTYGRQRIVHGNQRFVGGVAWRQNEQTYDGFRTQWASDFGLKSDYAYVYNVNRIFSPGARAFDIGSLANLDAVEYEELQPTYWPAPVGGSASRLLSDGKFYLPAGRAQFVLVVPELPVSETAGRGDLILNTGRLRDQWHTMTRTGLVPKLMRHQDFYSVAVNPRDAARRGLREGELVELQGNDTRLRALLRIDEGLPPGQLFSPIHWNDQFSGEACVSRLFPAITDPVSGQPQLKYARVALKAPPVGL